jgi:hypothetical protein
VNLIKHINASEIQPIGKRGNPNPSDSSDKMGLTDFYNIYPEGADSSLLLAQWSFWWTVCLRRD